MIRRHDDGEREHYSCLAKPYRYYPDLMLTNKLKELQAARARLAELENEVSSARNSELATLPSRYGFESVEAFLAAVKSAAGKKRGRKSAATAKPAPAKRRTRAKVTDEMRAEVKKMVAAEKIGAEIAKALGISLPTVQNIKKALGLVRKPKK